MGACFLKNKGCKVNVVRLEEEKILEFEHCAGSNFFESVIGRSPASSYTLGKITFPEILV
jgi:hypothetical protein